jgi:hypothetical protein
MATGDIMKSKKRGRRGRPKGVEPRIAVSFRLPKSLVDQLREAGGSNLSDDVRERLIRSLAFDKHQAQEKELFELLRQINEIAHMVALREAGEWHADANANKIFAAAVKNQILGRDPPPNRPEHEYYRFTEQEIEVEGRIIAEAFRTLELRERGVATGGWKIYVKEEKGKDDE